MEVVTLAYLPDFKKEMTWGNGNNTSIQNKTPGGNRRFI
jgi:hypothetical protein